MFFKKSNKNFNSDQKGAVTVDWVVLTAAIVALGITLMTLIDGGVDALIDGPIPAAPSN